MLCTKTDFLHKLRQAATSFVSRKQKELPIGWENALNEDLVICPALLPVSGNSRESLQKLITWGRGKAHQASH